MAEQSAAPVLSAPASQESFVSSAPSSGASPAPGPMRSCSSVESQSTFSTDNESGNVGPVINKFNQENGVPKGHVGTTNSVLDRISENGPMPTNGAKRTASGHVKNAPSLPLSPLAPNFSVRRRSRAESLSSTGSRAGELAASLRTRLGYAMAKVQNGWEHRTIAEVEQLAGYKSSPNENGMSQMDYSKRPTSSGLSKGTANLSVHDTSVGAVLPPHKRHSRSQSSILPSQSFYHPIVPTRHLQPAPNIHPSERPSYRFSPNFDHANDTSMSPPRTPVSARPRRPPTIRTDTQTAEAERDALQALFQLGSPHNSQMSRLSQASSAQTSPVRSDFPTPRKVAFARSESDASADQVSSADGGEYGCDERSKIATTVVGD